ncbi:hypothetical protein MKW98_030288 [Papaver atlanticum]|uniref:Uncharacterized protein n=1 Tax=Papaver atlanticum TaxID=357466 RepID=A0AAD4TJ57_9MAGN|nr:hypothetical protein MKW98_030288 [Papaver atlanticum]
MLNSLCEGIGTVKSENSPCPTNQQPTSSNASIQEPDQVPGAVSKLEKNSTASLSSLNFQALKFEDDDDVVGEDVHPSEENNIWESLFNNFEQIDSISDFMMSSPLRTPDYMISSPRRIIIPPQSCGSNNEINYDYLQRLEMQNILSDGCSSSPPYTTTTMQQKGKSSMSPLQRVYNSNTHTKNYNNNHNSSSSNNNNNHFLLPESLELPAMEGLEELIDQVHRHNQQYLSSGESFDHHSQHHQMPATLGTILESLPLQNDDHNSRFCGGSLNDHEQMNNQQEVNLYDQFSSFERQQHQLQQLQLQQQLLQNSQQQQQHNNIEHGLMAPVLGSLPSGSVQEQDSGLQLVHLLLACAEAVAKEDYMLAKRYIHHLGQVVTPLGDSMQRVASYFTEALTTRLSTVTLTPTTCTPKPYTAFPPNSFEILKIYQTLYQACPYIKFAHFTANQAIFEAFECEERVHIIDLDILQGYQWPAFIQALAARKGGAPFLRITGVGSPPEFVKETGRCLTELAHSLHVRFEFHPVGERLEDLKSHMLQRRVGEALAVNSVNRLHRVSGNYLGNLLGMIRDQAPNIVTLVEQEASHNGPYFLGRFLEALHYYSAIFDSLHATFPANSPERVKVEHYIFAPEIRNIVACEGSERVERHERLEKWRKLMKGKGFKEVALSQNAVTQSKLLLGLYSCDGYRLTEDRGCLLLGWQDRAILAASAWRC